jgi:tetratricopeptide (TPR) repeat protein
MRRAVANFVAPTAAIQWNQYSGGLLADHAADAPCSVPQGAQPLPPMPRIASSTAVLCAALLLFAAARADEVDEVSRMVAAGQSSEALARAERFLAAKPNDAAMRFQKGVILGETGRADEAIEVYTRLTQDFPDLPEPYNNLGVLLSARGDYEQARVALETAVRNNPNYAVAHENLGDIQALLASQSYARAIRLDPGNTSAPPKLALIRELLARSARAPASPAAAIRSPAS